MWRSNHCAASISSGAVPTAQPVGAVMTARVSKGSGAVGTAQPAKWSACMANLLETTARMSGAVMNARPVKDSSAVLTARPVKVAEQ